MTPAEFKQARQSLGLSQVELAPMLGYSRSSQISDIERGVRTVSAPVALLMRVYAETTWRPE